LFLSTSAVPENVDTSDIKQYETTYCAVQLFFVQIND